MKGYGLLLTKLPLQKQATGQVWTLCYNLPIPRIEEKDPSVPLVNVPGGDNRENRNMTIFEEAVVKN